jgi:Bacterial proteasome activator
MSADEASPEVAVVPEGTPPETHPEALEHPAKVMRIGAMVRNLLEEVRQSPLDEASRERLRDIYETSVKELGEVLSPELRDELSRLSLPFDEGSTPSQSELRVAHAQLVGWLEGLFHGIQAMLFAQQQENLARLEELRRRGLPSGQTPPEHAAGTYL